MVKTGLPAKMFVEDAIINFANRMTVNKDQFGETLRANTWTAKFVVSVASRCSEGRPLSTAQAKSFMGIVKQHKSAIIGFGVMDDREYEYLTEYPRYKQEPYQSTVMPREVRYLGDNKLGFRFKWSDELLYEFKKFRKEKRREMLRDEQIAIYSRSQRMWIAAVTRDTIKSLMRIIRAYDFAFDDAVAEYFLLCENSRDVTSTMAHDPESNSFVVNICDNETLAAWIKHSLYGEPV